MVGVGGRWDIFKGTLNKAIKESKQLCLFLVLQCALSCGCGPELFSEIKLMIIRSGVPGLLWKEMLIKVLSQIFRKNKMKVGFFIFFSGQAIMFFMWIQVNEMESEYQTKPTILIEQSQDQKWKNHLRW